MHSALYYEILDNDNIVCLLCPHGCVLKNGQTGLCHARKSEGKRLISINYGEISSVAIDPIEKKPLYHFLPNSKTLSFGSFGCNMKCPYCQNHSISQERPKTRFIDPEKAVEMAVDYAVPSMAHTYNEPLIAYEWVLDTAKTAKKKGIKSILVTNGYINPEPFLELLEYIDALNIDLKVFDEDIHRKFTGGRLEPVLQSIENASRKCHVEVTTLIVPGMNDDEGIMEREFKWLAGIKKTIPLHLSRYFPRYNYNMDATDKMLILRMKKLAEKYLDNVYIGNM